MYFANESFVSFKNSHGDNILCRPIGNNLFQIVQSINPREIGNVVKMNQYGDIVDYKSGKTAISSIFDEPIVTKVSDNSPQVQTINLLNIKKY